MLNEVYLVGKGLSLDYLTIEQFPYDYPIVCINESCQKIRKLNLVNDVIGCCKEPVNPKHICPFVEVLWTVAGNIPHFKPHIRKIEVMPDASGWDTINTCVNYLGLSHVKVIHALAFDYFCNGSILYTKQVDRSIQKDGESDLMSHVMNMTLNQVRDAGIVFNVINTVKLIKGAL